MLLSIFLVGCSSDDGGPVVDPNITQTIGAAGGTFNFQNNQVRLLVPAGSLSGNTNVTVRSATGYGPDARLLNGSAYTLSNDSGATFSSSNKATLRIHYASLPIGADPNTLEIFRWNGTTWEQVNTSTVDIANQTVSAQISQMGTYAIFITGGIGNPDVYKTVLTDAQEVGATAGNAGGLGIVEIAENQLSLTVTINGTRNVNLANVTAAHIHSGALGENGPIAATVYMQSMGAFTDPYSKVVTFSDLNTSVVPNMAALIDLIQSNHAYLNVHTTANPAGFIRGQIGPSITMEAHLSGDNEVPVVTTTAMGDATVSFEKNLTTITVNVNTTGLGLNAVTAASIRLAPPTENGPALFNLTPTTNWDGTMTFTLHDTDFMASGEVDSYLQAIGAILGGRTYIQVSTAANPNGEIRGQIIPQVLG